MSLHETIETMQRQASENMAMSLMRMSVSDHATKDRLQSLLNATEKHDAAKRAAETARNLAEVAEESASRRLAEAEKRAGEIAAEAEAWRKRHNAQAADLHAGMAELEKQRGELEQREKAIAQKREAHARMVERLRQHLDEVAL